MTRRVSDRLDRVISSGDEQRTRAENFGSPVLLDPEFSVGQVFGAAGTPSAVMVDPDGRVASEVMVGADAILGRLRRLHLVHVR